MIGNLSVRTRRFAESHGCKCVYCGTAVDVHNSNKPESASRDHVVPLQVVAVQKNPLLVLACYRCNSMRGTMNHDAFRRLMLGEALRRDELWPHLFGSAA